MMQLFPCHNIFNKPC